jgi:hypothetical protein
MVERRAGADVEVLQPCEHRADVVEPVGEAVVGRRLHAATVGGWTPPPPRKPGRAVPCRLRARRISTQARSWPCLTAPTPPLLR